MPYLFPLDENGKPGAAPGRINLTAATGGPVVHRLVYNCENIATVSIYIRKGDATASFGTTASLTAKPGITGEGGDLEAFASAVTATDFGVFSNRAMSARPRMVINLDTVGGGSPAGEAEFVVWGEPAR